MGAVLHSIRRRAGQARPLQRHVPAIILAAYVALAVIYSAVTPVFEAPDENYHFAFIQRLIQSWELPVQDPAIKTPWYQEGSQPPLYYLLASLVARLVPADYEPYPLAVNPHAQIGIGLAQINHNFFVHTSAEVFPWRGIALQVHLVRFLSVALGACTVYAVYRTARLAVPGAAVVAPLAMAFTAFNPMFLFVSASINNDNLVTTFGALASWLTLAIIAHGLTLRRGVPLAVVIALASLSKISGLTLYIVAGALLAILILKRQITWRQMAAAVIMFGAAFALIAGWWYVRNLQLYGDPTGLRTMIAIIEPRQTPYTVLTMLDEMPGLRISFWALFGWFNVIGPDWFLASMDVLTVIALVGGIGWAWREIRVRRLESLLPVGMLGLQFLVTFASLINWTRLTPGTQGRLLFPAMAAIATLAALGWYSATETGRSMCPLALRGARPYKNRDSGAGKPAPKGKIPRLMGEGLLALPVIVMVVVAVLSPFLTIRRAYALPPVIARLPDDAIPVGVRFDKIAVVGFRIDWEPVPPGGELSVTIYYRGEPDARNLSLSLTALDREGRPIGKIDTYPGGGNLPTSALNAGSIYVDTYPLPIDGTARGPMQPKIELVWWDFETKERIKPVNADGTPLDALILRGGTLLSADPQPKPDIAQPAVFSGALRLTGYSLSPADGLVRPGDSIRVSLVWEGLMRVYEDFTVFVHLETDNGQLIGQDDAPPLRGDYPTSAWAVGQPFADQHTVKIDAPPGTYRLTVGLYRARDGSRLPVDAGGDMLILKTPITVK